MIAIIANIVTLLECIVTMVVTVSLMSTIVSPLPLQDQTNVWVVTSRGFSSCKEKHDKGKLELTALQTPW